jgi:uncharacterized membrane protein
VRVNNTRKRTLVSAITYRAAATVLLGVISYTVTGEFTDTSVITVAFTVLATVVYYFNERAWNRVDWGKNYTQD